MQRAYRLRKNKQFQYVYHKGRSCASREIVLLYIRASRLQVGFSVSRKVGNSVMRNRVKRRLRAACVPLLPRMKKGLYVFIARQPALTADFDKLCRSMQYLLRRQNLLLPEETARPAAHEKKAGDRA